MGANSRPVEGAKIPSQHVLPTSSCRPAQRPTRIGTTSRLQSTHRSAWRRHVRRTHRAEAKGSAPTEQREDEGAEDDAEDPLMMVDAVLQPREFESLKQLAQGSSWDRDEINTLGGVEAVLTAMQTNTSKSEVQLFGSLALHALTSRHEIGTRDFMLLGGVQAVVTVMCEHLSVLALQEAGCGILRNAAACSSEAKEKVASLGGVQAVLGAMKAHPMAPSVQESGLRALREIAAHNVGGAEGISSSGGIQVILRAMENHRALRSIQVYGCGVIRNMTTSNLEHQEGVVSRGGIQVILVAMQWHLDSADVQWAGCWALCCLAARNKATRAEVAAYGAVRAALQAMERHRSEPRVQEAGCWVLKELAGQPPAGTTQPLVGAPPGSKNDKTANLVAGAQALLKAMERHPSSVPVQSAASAALRKLVLHDAGGWIRTTCMGRCGRLGRSTTMRALSTIKEALQEEDEEEEDEECDDVTAVPHE